MEHMACLLYTSIWIAIEALLLLDNAPGYPKDLEDNFMENVPWLRVQFLPMDQEVIAGFKKLYPRALFRRCFEACQLKHFGKKHMIFIKLSGLFKRRDQKSLTQRQLNSARWKLCPSCIQWDGDDVPKIMDEIVTTARDLKLEVNEYDIE